MDKKKTILEVCDKVMNGLEENDITVTFALLLCMKIARLCNDFQAIKWLSYENGGYPRNKDNNITKEGYDIATMHGREYINNSQKYVFTDMVGELEAKIASKNKVINNFSTQ